jgi:hypothetical protein
MILEDRGYFWWSNEAVPDDRFAPDSAVPGNLMINDEGGSTLELDALLPDPSGPLAGFFRSDDADIRDRPIQGILKGTGNRVLLLGLARRGGVTSSYKIPHESFFALTCLVGDKLFHTSTAPLKFFKLEIDLTGLEQWLRLASIEVRRSRILASAKYKQNKEVTYRVGDDKLSIRYNLEVPVISGMIRHHTVNLKETAALVYVLRKSATLQELQRLYDLFQDLFILLTGTEYPLDWPVFYLGRNRERCKLYFYRVRNPVPPPWIGELWTFFPQIQSSFGAIFSLWRRKRETFGAGFYLYLGTRRGMRLYPEHRFLNLIWGIETLHRRRHQNASQPSPLKRKIDRIINQISSRSDKRWLEGQLRFAAEPALQQRIFETFENLPISLDADKIKNFSKICADKRNEISHFGGVRQGESNIDPSRQLEAMSEALGYLYHILLLSEIGINRELLNDFTYRGMQAYMIKKAFFDVGLIDEQTLKSTSVPGRAGA